LDNLRKSPLYTHKKNYFIKTLKFIYFFFFFVLFYEYNIFFQFIFYAFIIFNVQQMQFLKVSLNYLKRNLFFAWKFNDFYILKKGMKMKINGFLNITFLLKVLWVLKVNGVIWLMEPIWQSQFPGLLWEFYCLC
jgi:hypothetical protein